MRQRRSSVPVAITNVTGISESAYPIKRDAGEAAERGESEMTFSPSGADGLKEAAIQRLQAPKKVGSTRNMITKTLGSNIRAEVTVSVFLKCLAWRVAGLSLTVGALGLGVWAFAHFGLEVEALTVIYMTVTMVMFLAVLMAYYDCCNPQFKQKTSTIMFVLYVITFNAFFFVFFDGPQHFAFGERLRDILVYEEFDRTDTNVIKSLYNVRELDELWQWLDGPCISRSGMFKEDEPLPVSSSSAAANGTGAGDGGDQGNGYSGWGYGDANEAENLAGMFDGGNYRLVGPVRLRQVRVAADCPSHRAQMATKMGMTCVSQIGTSEGHSADWVSKEAYGPKTAGFTYQNEEYEMWWPPQTTGATSKPKEKATATQMWSIISSVFVPAGGFTYTLPYNATVEEAQAHVLGLRTAGWIDRHTGAVLVELTVVDANANLFAFVRIMFEFVDVGGIRPQIQMYIWQPTRNVDRILCGLWFTFVLFYTNEAVGNMFVEGKRYCMSWWNVFDWVGILTGATALAMAGAMYLSSPVNSYGDVNTPANWLQGDQQFLDFSLTARCANFFHWAVGINAFLTLIKVTKYAKQYWIRIWLVNRTITKAGKDIVAFMVIFLIVIIACAEAFTMLFAKDIHQLRSIGVSVGTLIDSMFGNLPLAALYNSDLPGTVFMAFFVLFAIFVLLTTLVAIMTDAYEQAHLHIMQLEANIREGKKGNRPLFDKKLAHSEAVLTLVFNENADATEPPKVRYKNKVYSVQWITTPPPLKNKDLPLGFKKIESTVNGTVTLTDDSRFENPPKKLVKPSLKAVATNIINSQVEKLNLAARSRSGTVKSNDPFAGVLRSSDAVKEQEKRDAEDLKHYAELVRVYNDHMVKLNEEQERLTEQVENLRQLDLAGMAFDAYERAERIMIYSEEVKAKSAAQREDVDK